MKTIPEGPRADGGFNEHNNSDQAHSQDGQQGPSSAHLAGLATSGEQQICDVETDEKSRGEWNNGKGLIEAENVLSGTGAIDDDDNDNDNNNDNNVVDIEKHPNRISDSSHPPENSNTPKPQLPEPDGLSRDLEGNIYPEGGLQAYLVVFGSFMALFGTLGLANSLGSFLAWISTHQLKDYSQRSISWIFGIYTFLMFFGGLQIGPIFDAKGPRFLVLAGAVMVTLSIALIGLCEEYWHFMVVWGIVGGISVSLVFTPAVASPGHFFYRLRGRATGIAATGGSVGGIVFPLMLQDLLPKVGFGWATRAVALVTLVSLTMGCILIKSRLPKKKATRKNILPDFRILWEPQFALTTLGVFFIEWGLFIPIAYIPAYALAHGMSEKFSHQVLAILNIQYHDRDSGDLLLILRMLVVVRFHSVAMLVVYALVFGFGSGSNISLTPVCIGQCCKTENYGRYYATSYTVVSLGTLTGTPIAGSILTSNGGNYWGLITFTTVCYFAGLVCFIAAKAVRHGRNLWVIY
ncbi:monocarboxylate permease-like protein [Histoplasma capsulatum var. duboisii H88]|uniref:Monocarboxylate permease-like protein n=1 Tax=Ajellomyces capsulatus (strain H88) TaxID=544711 RepID=F0UKI9_AJEC8|nr:monocarboxylate permease-like protein [Histoplasma capsulatum var. duboisii H88]